MGKYDGLLICSDFDGTLFVSGSIPEANLHAIEKFEKEGGLFSLCSGRLPTVLEEKHLPLTLHTPMICLNGAMIYDHSNQKIVFEGLTDGHSLIRPMLQVCREKASEIKSVHIYMPNVVGAMVSPYDTESITALLSQPIYKTVLSCHRDGGKEADDQRGRQLRKFCRQIFSPDLCVMRSWDIGVEIQELRYSKGKMARRLANMVGADQLICVGDYENDISMLQEADLSFTVENATEETKAAADHVLCHAQDGAIADLISRL